MPTTTRLPPLPTVLVIVLGTTAVLTPPPAHATEAGGLCRRVVSSSFATSVLSAGDGTTQTVVLDRPAPPGGVFVDLVGGNVGYRESARNGLRFPEGRQRWTFPVRFTGRTSQYTDTYRDMTATTACSSVNSGPVTVRPIDPAVLDVESVTFLPRVAPADSRILARVRLTAPARPTGTTVRLYGGRSYGGGYILRPLIATVPAGARSVDLPIRTLANPTNEPQGDVMRAYLTSNSMQGVVYVLPSDLYVSGDLQVGQTTQRARVSLGRPAPAGGAHVVLSDTRADIDYPRSVTVPAGAHTVTFPVATPRPEGTGSVTATWDGETTTSTIHFDWWRRSPAHLAGP